MEGMVARVAILCFIRLLLQVEGMAVVVVMVVREVLVAVVTTLALVMLLGTHHRLILVRGTMVVVDCNPAQGILVAVVAVSVGLVWMLPIVA